jgi:hypothetical protein
MVFVSLRTRLFIAAAFSGLLLLSFPALAARPFVTDDARLTTAGSCQLESWSRIYPESREIWALPACNPGGNFEFTVGGGVAQNNGESSTSDFVFQGKTLFKPLETDGWGIGLAAGTVQHPAINPGPNQYGNEFAYIPFSTSWWSDAVIVHTNVGWLREKETKQETMTWGIGSELLLTHRLLGIVEIFGDERGKPFYQIGFRYSIIPNLFQVDTTIGQQIDAPSQQRWISFGIRYTPDNFF